MIEKENDNVISNSFFVDKNKETLYNASLENSNKEIDGSSFRSKGINKKLEEPYNIFFTLRGGTFNNMINFLSDIDYNIAMCFKKGDVSIVAVDSGNAYGCIVKFERTEFADYVMNCVEGVDEKWILINSSIITDKMTIKEEMPVDFYVDTLKKNRFYIINGKESCERQLSSVSTGNDEEAMIHKHMGFETLLNRIIGNPDYQKTVITYTSMLGVIKSLIKKTDKSKDSTTVGFLYLNKYEIDWKVGNEVESSSIVLSGDDVIVYPVKEDVFKFSLKFFGKLGKLKTSNNVEMYINGELPLILNTRIGGGGAEVWFLLAPRTE